jgi:hypothetical protein
MIPVNYNVPIRAIRRKTKTHNNTILLMQVGENHATTLRFLLDQDIRLARFYFCALFDGVDYGTPGTGFYNYSEDNIQIGEPTNSLYPISMEVRLSPYAINRLRELTKSRIPPLSAFIQMECRD